MSTTTKMTVKDWIITFLITSLPLINIIMLFVWAFGDGTNEVKKTWAKAALVWFAIIIVLYFIFGVAIFGALMGGAASSGAFDSY